MATETNQSDDLGFGSAVIRNNSLDQKFYLYLVVPRQGSMENKHERFTIDRTELSINGCHVAVGFTHKPRSSRRQNKNRYGTSAPRGRI